MITLKITGNKNNVKAFSKFISAAVCSDFDERVSDTEYKFENQEDAEKALDYIYNRVKISIEEENGDIEALEKGTWNVSFDGVEASI